MLMDTSYLQNKRYLLGFECAARALAKGPGQYPKEWVFNPDFWLGYRDGIYSAFGKDA